MDGPDLYLFQAIHQEADVVPENVDAVRAIADVATKEESVERTNEALGVGSGLTDHAVDHANPISDAASDD